MIFKKQVRLLQPHMFFLTVFHPERPRCHVIMFLEYPMKITVIFIAYSRNDVTDRQISFTHQLYSLVQTFSLKKFLEIKPCAFLDHLTEDMHGKMQTTTKLRQRSSPIFLFNIIQCCHRDHIFVLIGQTHLHIEDIVLLISDDGVGISPEILSTILSGKGKSQSGGTNIAVYNTHRRLQILYGNNYGLTYSSKPGEGTDVEIRFPAHREK